MRILVAWLNNCRLVIPVSNENDKVESLFPLITTRVRSASPEFHSDNRFVRLELNGFALNPADLIKDVLATNDHLTAVDYFTFIQDAKKECKDYWYDYYNHSKVKVYPSNCPNRHQGQKS